MHVPTKIPTILGIFLTILIVGGIMVGSESYVRTMTAASGSIQPATVQITNVSDTMFTVSWTTQMPATGALSISSPGKTYVLFDDQDTKSQGKYLTHSVTFREAIADTDYAVTILSNGKNINGTTPYSINTGPALTTTSGNLEPAYGTIVTDNNQPISGALVYLTLEGGQTLSTVSKPSGTWLIPLNLVRTQDLNSFLTATDRTGETISVEVNGMKIQAVTDTLNDSPVPPMIPGKTYDFRNLNAQAVGRTVLGNTTTKPAANTVSFVIPAQGAALPTTLPLIQGTGIAGKTVSLILGITNPVGDTTIVGADGLWSYTPKQPLAPGHQSVTMTTTNAQNKTVAMTHMFEILKSGTQVLGDATPSATPTVEFVASPSATPEESTLAAQPVPNSGYDVPAIILVILGTGLMIGGVLTFI